jgi:hypothetical protein
MTKFDKITERHFARVVEIVINGDNEFHDIGERMTAITSRAEIWCNEMVDAQHEDDE